MQRVDDWAERLRPALARVVAAKGEAVTQQGRQLVRPEQYVAAKQRDLAAVLGRLAAAKSAGDAKLARDLRDAQSLGQRLKQAADRRLKNVDNRLVALDK
ncbi:MAG: hypothetical protein VW453_13640, partial [Rhodospirillaceae bacterium]